MGLRGRSVQSLAAATVSVVALLAWAAPAGAQLSLSTPVTPLPVPQINLSTDLTRVSETVDSTLGALPKVAPPPAPAPTPTAPVLPTPQVVTPAPATTTTSRPAVATPSVGKAESGSRAGSQPERAAKRLPSMTANQGSGPGPAKRRATAKLRATTTRVSSANERRSTAAVVDATRIDPLLSTVFAPGIAIEEAARGWVGPDGPAPGSGFGVSREEGVPVAIILAALLGSLLLWAGVFRRALSSSPPSGGPSGGPDRS
jgi:hypothetical protein